MHALHFGPIGGDILNSYTPLDGRRRDLVHTICVCSVTLRIFGLWIIQYFYPFTNPSIHSQTRSIQFVAGHLPFEPHSDSAVQL